MQIWNGSTFYLLKMDAFACRKMWGDVRWLSGIYNMFGKDIITDADTGRLMQHY